MMMTQDKFYLYLIYFMLIQGVLAMITLFYFKNAPYGRYNSTKNGIKPIIAWIIMESPTLIMTYVNFLRSERTLIPFTNYLLLSMFVLHYINRAIVYPFRISSNGKPMPIHVCFLGSLFCTINGYLQSYTFLIKQVEDFHQMDALVVIGMIVWVVGLCINVESDERLMRLRKPGEGGYKIPRGGMFEYVSAANYFGEIIEWIGYSVACRSFAGGMFGLWTIFAILPRGYNHHKWYLQKFKEEYPKSRKAVLPFIF